MISPHDVEVIRVISFSDSHLNKNGVIVYRRPLTLNYNKDVLDDFDESFIKWLKQLNFQNVTLWHSEDILFDNQLNHYQQVLMLLHFALFSLGILSTTAPLKSLSNLDGSLSNSPLRINPSLDIVLVVLLILLR